ncbi:DUF3052 family protein [Hufsiella ginkgonis]|uniref:DUF3052 family protein n=1 Tax=Hufsiella ginkgonis TaxID=2695274 RepID=A0A7K1XV45_9SPHI|nr:DUF3052 family protein [Hufsiella ginkgonis]MXV14639.1 DUF3052 family protein [Hufsiella ginkgonis]
MSSGYSQTPLAKKLGIKAGFSVFTVNEPAHFRDLLTDLPERVNWNNPESQPDLVHLFIRSAAEVKPLLTSASGQIKRNGTIWVSWPKKTSGIVSDMSENLVRDTALAMGLVDVKVCAVDETWSGLKIVWRTENR